MQIAYIYPPLFKPFYPMATRLITENLLRDRRLKVEFSDIPVRTYQAGTDGALYRDFLRQAQTRFPPNAVSFLKQKYIVNSLFYVFMAHGYYEETLLREPDSPVVVITCINFCDLLLVAFCLDRGKKVVLGGPLVNIQLSPSFIRSLLRLMGVAQRLLGENLIILTGNIDRTTDLYGLIRQWRDTAITENNYGTLYECQRDFLMDLYQGTGRNTPVHFGFHTWCWYGKCKFCTYRKLPKMDFLTHVGPERIIPYIHDMMKRCGSHSLRFIDSYYRPDAPKVQEILDEITSYHITIYSGIALLKNRAYVDFFNRYVDCLLIGLESTSDFSLQQVDKGYGLKDIEQAMDTLVQHLDRRIFLEISLILDLPVRDEQDAQENYERITRIKQRLEGEGFKVAFHMNILSVFPNMELLSHPDGPLRASSRPEDLPRSTGKNHLIHILRESGMERPSLLPQSRILLDPEGPPDLTYGYLSSDVPIMRYDIHGNPLPSDLYLMDEAVMKEILRRRSRRLPVNPEPVAA